MTLITFKNKLTASIAALVLFLITPMCAVSASTASYFEGCSAYSKGDWSSAVFLLRKAVAYSENDTPDAYYMLITAEIYLEDNKSALTDCDTFLNSFPTSLYAPRIKYLRGKLLYSLGEYDKAVVALSDFCHTNPDSELYASALFYIAESFYADYKFEDAEGIYETIVTKYPEYEKVAAAQYRIDSIAQRSREEKLLYLLKQTGEEYLAAKEEYEKQLKYFNSDAISSTRDKLNDSQAELEESLQHNLELKEQIADLEQEIALLKAERLEREAEEKRILQEQELERIKKQQENEEALARLKAKAKLVESLMNSEK